MVVVVVRPMVHVSLNIPRNETDHRVFHGMCSWRRSKEGFIRCSVQASWKMPLSCMACTTKESNTLETSRTMLHTMHGEDRREFAYFSPCCSPPPLDRFSSRSSFGLCIGVCDLCGSSGEAQTPTSASTNAEWHRIT